MTPEMAARAWDASDPRLVSERENAVYRVRLAGGEAAALRLHRPGYQTAAAIRSELWWMSRLAEAGVAVPTPMPARSGGFLLIEGDRIASMVGWVQGTPLGSGGSALRGDSTAVARQFRALGGVIAGMHNATDDMSLPADFERPRWDREGLLGTHALWGHGWENPSLTKGEADNLREAADVALLRLDAAIETGIDFGLIHADLLRENILIDGNRLSLIDFDDAGFGFRAYDLATAEVQWLEDPMHGVAQAALLDGYRAARRAGAPPLGDVSLFVALRSFASAGWAATRLTKGDPRQRLYAERALRAAEGLTGA